jgi:hypothetical protein
VPAHGRPPLRRLVGSVYAVDRLNSAAGKPAAPNEKKPRTPKGVRLSDCQARGA